MQPTKKRKFNKTAETEDGRKIIDVVTMPISQFHRMNERGDIPDGYTPISKCENYITLVLRG